jgi:hypothetical protein
MSMKSAAPMQPEDVFTPRAPTVNARMYIHRAELERALSSGLTGAKHLVLHGESGSGKSWLYKKVFGERQVTFEVANLANASRLGSIAAELKNVVGRRSGATKTGYTETKETEFTAVVASGKLANEGNFEVPQPDSFERCLQVIRKAAGVGAPAVLVLDNLESIFSVPERLKELADLVTLLDDENYAKYGVRFLIVGVPSGLQRYFYETPHAATVGNRLTELPEVFRFDETGTRELVRRGFVELLEYIDEGSDLFARVAHHVAWVTGGIPQRVHEYCLVLAQVAQREGRFSRIEDLATADQEWLKESGYQAYSAVEASMNERATTHQRRNQVLFVLGQLKEPEFRYAAVEEEVRRHFPRSTDGTNLNVLQMLSGLAALETPVIRRSPKGDAYVFTDPVYRMAIRTMLSIDDESEQVKKKDVGALFSG